MILARNGPHEIHAELEKIQKVIAGFSAGLTSGLWVRSDADLEAEAEADNRQREEWIREHAAPEAPDATSSETES